MPPGQIVEIPVHAPCYHQHRDATGQICADSALCFPLDYSLFDGFLTGQHTGVTQFRLGQRKGVLAGGGHEPRFVIGRDIAANRLFVGAGKYHPGLWFRRFCFEPDRLKSLPDPACAIIDTEEVTVFWGHSQAHALLDITHTTVVLTFTTAQHIALYDRQLTLSNHGGVTGVIRTNFN